ncbi:hypothetical protein [Novispirillum itersonii]|uniref:Uncharacterized protein n=1 Tax=Novispirillum itersonii TaxID=189 RepID=A0A7W9ZIW8_NOVIT|nr:hypothetical protein [Novispirillum itersonii]MBB6211437.1 hypothetical protein [Novispirillum itersonii]
MIGPVERARAAGATFAIPYSRRDDTETSHIQSLDAVLASFAASLNTPQSAQSSSGSSFEDGASGDSGQRREQLLQSGRQQVILAGLDGAEAAAGARQAVIRNDVVAARSAAQQVAGAARSIRAAAQVLAEAAGGSTAANAAAGAVPASVTRPVSDGGVLPATEMVAQVAQTVVSASASSQSASQPTAFQIASGQRVEDLAPVGISPSVPGGKTGSDGGGSGGNTGNDASTGGNSGDQAEQAARRAAAALAASRTASGEAEDIPPVGHPLGPQPVQTSQRAAPGEQEDLPPVGPVSGDNAAKQDSQQRAVVQAITDVARRASDTLRQGQATLGSLATVTPQDEVSQRALQASLGDADREIGLAAFTLTQVVEGLAGVSARPAPAPAAKAKDTRKLDLSI